jgi:hypothetical protein
VSQTNRYREMLIQVAEAIGSELRQQIAFVGGSTTALLLTDDFTREQVRHTDDVDLIVHLVGYASYGRLQKQLRALGFRESVDNDDPLGSRDIEDLLNLFDGRPELLAEIKQATPELRQYIAVEIVALLNNSDFGYAVQSCALGDGDRETLIYERLEQAAKGVL